jgi:agmatinase
MQNQKYAFIGCQSEYKGSRIVLFGAPFDGTSSYRAGSRSAPSSIRMESQGIETYSPYLGKDLAETAVFDRGDLELPMGNARQALRIIRKNTASILDDGKKPFMIGGEHLVTLGAFEAAAEKYQDLCLIHFDAHTDLREDYLGEKLSHATVVKRIWEITGDNRIFQFGIRSGMKEEFEWAKKHTCLTRFNFGGLSEAIQKIKDKPVYLTIDFDVLDPSEMPGTGTPEAGGVRYKELFDAIRAVSACNVVACDVVELCPPLDNSGISVALACKLLREILLQL